MFDITILKKPAYELNDLDREELKLLEQTMHETWSNLEELSRSFNTDMAGVVAILNSNNSSEQASKNELPWVELDNGSVEYYDPSEQPEHITDPDILAQIPF